MKTRNRIASLIVAGALIAPLAGIADVPDVASMTDEELTITLEAVKAELSKRSGNLDGLVLSRDGITVTRNGDPYVERVYLRIPIIIQNDTDEETTIVCDQAIINGWTVAGIAPGFAAPHSKLKDELVFKIDDAECSTLEDVKTIDAKYYLEMKVDGKYKYNNEISDVHFEF